MLHFYSSFFTVSERAFLAPVLFISLYSLRRNVFRCISPSHHIQSRNGPARSVYYDVVPAKVLLPSAVSVQSSGPAPLAGSGLPRVGPLRAWAGRVPSPAGLPSGSAGRGRGGWLRLTVVCLYIHLMPFVSAHGVLYWRSLRNARSATSPQSSIHSGVSVCVRAPSQSSSWQQPAA